MNSIVNDLMTHYDRRGKGRQILLIHGWGDSLKTFEAIAGILEKDNEIILLDLPGFGESETPKTAWGLEQYAHFVAEFLTKVGVKPYVIIGHSNGGAIAIKGLAAGTLHADKLILIASAGIRARQSARKLVWKLVAKTGKAVTVVLPQQTRQKLRRRMYQTAGSDLLVAPHMEETFKKVVGEDIQPEAALLQLPTLLVYGLGDTATPPTYGESFHKLIENSKLHLIEDAGHFVHQEKASEVAALVKEFVG